MITIKDLNNIISEGEKKNLAIKVGEVAFAILSYIFKDPEVSYTVVFGKPSSKEDVAQYSNGAKNKFIKSYIKKNKLINIAGEGDYKDISFEENKDAMIKMIDELKVALTDGKIEYKEYSDRVTKLRIALNDKFSVSDKKDNHTVIVYKKFNDICTCGREIYRPTKEDIMEELKKEYELIPKKKETES